MNQHDTVISLDHEYTMQTYSKLDVVPESGTGSVLTDFNGKKYIDFSSGIGVNALGYSDKGWIFALTSQLEKISHFSNYFYSAPTSLLAEKLIKLTGLKRVFFGNSGAEANECAIKLARKYSFDKYGSGRNTIITLNNSFHGRTVTTLAATGQEQFHNYFFPFTEGFRYTPLNDVSALHDSVTGDVCAVMAEIIQGEGGVNMMDTGFAKALEKICSEKDILLIVDEVQTGIGRTGRFFSYEKFSLKPDIVTSAKALGGGLPIGAVICGEKCEHVFSAGQHGTTFGGNPVICAGAGEIVRRVSDGDFLKSVTEKGKYIKNKIAAMNIPFITDIRGDGLMIGIEVSGDPKYYLKKAAENGLLILTAGKNVLRLLPPLTVSYDEIEAGLRIFELIFDKDEVQ